MDLPKDPVSFGGKHCVHVPLDSDSQQGSMKDETSISCQRQLINICNEIEEERSTHAHKKGVMEVGLRDIGMLQACTS